MYLHTIDWLIVGLLIGGLGAMAWYTKRYTRSVADFLSANRSANRYLLTMAEGTAGLGAITIVANWEKFYQAGFAASFWGEMMAPIGLVIALSGWIIYRFRETRALTMAQFLERRYSRRFRIFTGVLAWVSGVINYAVFPLVTGNFLIYFTGLPVYTCDVWGLSLNLTLGAVMFVLLGIAVAFALSGGQIAVMVTDFLAGQLTNIVLLILLVVMLSIFSWDQIVEALAAAPRGQSMLNPFDQGELPDFGPEFFFMMAFINIYSYMAWQGSQGYYSAARTPHEAKMSRILAGWRGGVTYLMISLIPICAYVMFHSPAFEAQASAAGQMLAAMPDQTTQKQMTTTVALSQVLPVGLSGLFCAVMLMAAISTDDTYLHSWGSIFIQDVVLPLRKKTLGTQTHLKLLRWSIVGVACFAWTFSMVFPLKQYIFMWFQITGAIFLGGAGAVIIGGLYWRRGTTTAAWAAMITGTVLAVTGILMLNIFWPYVLPEMKAAYPQAGWLSALPERFPLNGMQLSFYTALTAVVVYVVVSLCTRDPGIDMDQLLHRGKYRVEGDHVGDAAPQAPRGWRALGVTAEFSFTDKLIYYFKLGWVLVFFSVFVLFTVWNLVSPWGEMAWAKWWHIKLWISIVVGTLTTVWFVIGGLRDLVDLFRRLRSVRRDACDDGTVREHLSKAPDDAADEAADPDEADISLTAGGLSVAQDS